MNAERLVVLDQIRDIPAREQNGHEPQPLEHSWRPLNLIQLAANPPQPPTIGGLLYPGKRTILSGETESMKTWFALILTKAELEAGHPVCWVDLDAMGAGAMLQRLQLLNVDHQLIDRDFHYIEPTEQLGPTQITELTDLIHHRNIRLFVIDAFNPILTLHGLDPNAVTDVERFWRTIADPICNAGAAPVLLDHVVKNPDNRGKYASGSERKASGAIVHLGFKLLEPLRKGGQGRTLLNVHKDRPGYLPRPAIGRLTLDATGPQITYKLEPDQSHGDNGEFRPTVLMQKVSIFLELHPGAATGNEIEKSVTGNAKAIRTGIELLIRDGYVRHEKGANRAHLYTSLRPYRETDDPTPTSSSPVRPEFVPNLKSVRFVSSSPPYGDEDEPRLRPEDEPRFVQPLQLESGENVPEYDHPPPDPSLYDPDRDPYHDPDDIRFK